MIKQRYLIRLQHGGDLTPSDQERLLVEARRRLASLPGAVMNLRVSRYAIEFDLFCALTLDVDRIGLLLAPLGKRITLKQLENKPNTKSKASVIAEARRLFNEERFWEVHEVLEGIWKQSEGAEKRWLQGWILISAALVHAQKNEHAVVWRMLQEGVRRLSGCPAFLYGLDTQRLVAQINDALKKRALTPFTV